MPVWLGHSEMGAPGEWGIEFEHDTAVCYSCYNLEAFRAENRDKSSKNPSELYGVTEFVYPIGWQAIEGEAVYSMDYLPTRESAYEDMALRAAIKAEREAEAEKG